MARDADFRARITADDNASKVLDQVAQAGDDLERNPIDVKVDANVSEVLSALDQVAGEAKQTQEAAAALSRSLGPELAGRADTTAIVGQLREMGLTMDQITGNADQLGGKLKELSDTDVGGKLGQGLGTARGETEKLSDSARGANSALANMIGNSAQDLGQLGGVAGSTGVAVGQMAEYFSDAALAGEGMGAALKSMVAVAGPILVLTAAVSAVSGAIDGQQRRAEAAAKTTAQFGDAMSGAADDSVGLADSLRKNQDALRSFDASASLFGGGTLGGIATVLNDAGKSIPLLGSIFQNTSVDIVDAMGDAGLSMYQFSSAIAGGAATRAKFKSDLEAFHDAGFITSDQFHAMTQAVDEYGASFDKASAAQKLFNVDQKEANAILKETVAQADPLSQMGDTWKTLFDDMADGSINTQAAAKAVNDLSTALGKTPEEIIAIAQQHLDEQMKDNAKATEEAAKAAADFAVKLAGAQASVNDLASAFAGISRRQDALASIFDLGNAPLDALGAMQDVEQGIRDFGEFLSKDLKGKVPDIFDPDDVNADDLLAKIASLRGPIQQQIADAFSAGGPQAAQQVSDNYVDQIVTSLKGKLTREQVVSLLGLDGLQAKIDVALDQSKIAQAKAALDILTGLNGETPFTATIALALNAGTITPDAANALINQQLAGAGVEIPSTLQTPDAGQATVAAAQWLRDHPLLVPTAADPTGAAKDTKDFAAGKQPTALVPLDANTKPAEQTTQSFTSQQRSTPPVTVDANTAAAINTILYLRILAAILQPVVTVTARLGDYPSAADIAARIGTVRVPIDGYVRNVPRIDGTRDGG